MTKPTSVFSKTGKAVLQLKVDRSRFTKLETSILEMVDGSTAIHDLAYRVAAPSTQFQLAVSALIQEGFIRSVSLTPLRHARAPIEENDLDFTHLA